MGTSIVQERVYARSLNRLIDVLFERAAKEKLTWVTLAGRSGLSYHTVVALGTRKTKRPQYRTVELLAHALGGRVDFATGVAKVVKVTWTPKIFGSKRKQAA